jgi:very-short-patch-repair endonuclease
VLTAPEDTVHRARRLRKTMSLPEVLLWQQLKLRPGVFKFRKQHPAGFYVLDFFCAEAKLAIEIDGEAHDCGDQAAFDEGRDRQLMAHGILTLRIPAVEVLNNLEGVVVLIVEAVRARLPLHHPSDGPPPRSGEELR